MLTTPRKVQRQLPSLARSEYQPLLNLCFKTNNPGSHSEDLSAWASSDSGRAFGISAARNLLNKSTPESFVLSVLTLLSYYRTLNGTQVFVPPADCEDYLSEFVNFDNLENGNGRVLERVAFSVINACRSLLPGVLTIPYLRPYQLDTCMEYSRSTAAVDIYCYTRMSQTCSHDEAVDSVRNVLGIAAQQPMSGPITQERQLRSRRTWEKVATVIRSWWRRRRGQRV